MEVDVKYQSEQQTKAKAFEQLIKLFRDAFGLEVTIGVKMKDNDINENTEKEFDKLMRESLKNRKDESAFTPSASLYELSFLKKMIAGEFDTFTKENFQTKKDKRLFEKFNSLSKKEKQNQFTLLKKQLESADLK